jgi:hypothetical protein
LNRNPAAKRDFFFSEAQHEQIIHPDFWLLNRHGMRERKEQSGIVQWENAP